MSGPDFGEIWDKEDEPLHDRTWASGVGVAVKLANREKFRCVCLRTFLKVPLTKVTLVEDFGMAALALVMLFVT